MTTLYAGSWAVWIVQAVPDLQRGSVCITTGEDGDEEVELPTAISDRL